MNLMIYVNMTTKERLKEFVSKQGLGQNAFEKKVGIAVGYLASKSVSVTSDTIEKVIENFPNLNLDWLITGEGEMLKNSGANENNTSFINVDDDLNTIEMEKKIKRLEASIDALIEKNERLEAQLAEYKAKEVIRKGTA